MTNSTDERGAALRQLFHETPQQLLQAGVRVQIPSAA